MLSLPALIRNDSVWFALSDQAGMILMEVKSTVAQNKKETDHDRILGRNRTGKS